MSQLRFLANHDLHEPIISGVLRREPAVELVTARELGLERATDPELLETAAQEGYIVVSHDVTTMTDAAKARVRDGQPMPGLFVIRQALPISRAIDALILHWSASEAEEWENQIVYLR